MGLVHRFELRSFHYVIMATIYHSDGRVETNMCLISAGKMKDDSKRYIQIKVIVHYEIKQV